ncbi:MAG: L-aspartate oxidase, partial [Mycobacterium sp.]|nr:L-aspartate oxidase [Mycobacterium sp.]
DVYRGQASNSLLEGLVVGGRAGRVAAEHARTAGTPAAKVDELQHQALDRTVLQQEMTRSASVVRDGAGLRELAAALGDAPARRIRDRADFEDVALTAAARAVAAAALARTESRGCHHRGDYPETDPAQAVSRTLRDTAAVATLP